MRADAGIRFGQYVLLRRIARGGMAEVFLAQQRGLEGFDRRVAVKRILPHLQDAPDFIKMFLSEARLAAQLAHPNIVHIYEFGKVANDYFIAMEFVEGVHVGQVFNKGETDRIPPTLVARIGADAAAALHYAHELRGPNGQPYGLVHRDVSPANIMISFDGIVKLCDFGIAKAAAAGDQLTNPGQVKGKYAYMSPEQTTASNLDGRSDVFALGIVLWELLTGKYIVTRGDAVAAMRAIPDGKLEPIEKAAPDVPAPLAKAVSAALEPKREKRSTAAELATALEGFIKSSPELATPMQLASWLRPRFPRESGNFAVVSSSSPGTSTGPGTQAHPSTRAQPSTQASPGTAEVSAGMMITPEDVAAQPTVLPVTPLAFRKRQVVKVIEDTAEGTEIYSVSDLEESATIHARRSPVHAPSDAATVIGRRNPADEATVLSGMSGSANDATEIVDARHLPRAPEDEDSLNNQTFMETTERDRRTPIPSAPSAVPTRVQPLGAGLPSQPSMQSPARGLQFSLDSRSPHTLRGTGTQAVLPRRRSSPDMGTPEPRQRTSLTNDQIVKLRRRKLLFTIGGLAGLMLMSFLIALCASSGSGTRAPAAASDASVIRMTDVDALPVAEPPLDAGTAFTPTIPVDAGPDATMATLVVRTQAGATIRVGNQTHVVEGKAGTSGSTQLLVPAGKVTVDGDLFGYLPETRTITIEKGATKTIELPFTKKLGKSGPTGKLSVTTTPWSDVYLGTQKLGQAPFQDLDLPVGTYSLTFRNPSHPAVVKTVTIKTGKPVRLKFNLP